MEPSENGNAGAAAPLLPTWYASTSLRPSVTSAAARLFAPPASSPRVAAFGATLSMDTRVQGKLVADARAEGRPRVRILEHSASTSDMPRSLSRSQLRSRARGPDAAASAAGHSATAIKLSTPLRRPGDPSELSSDVDGGRDGAHLPPLSRTASSTSTASRGTQRLAKTPSQTSWAHMPSAATNVNGGHRYDGHTADAAPPRTHSAMEHADSSGQSSILRRAVFGDSRARQVAADVMRTDQHLRDRLRHAGLLAVHAPSRDATARGGTKSSRGKPSAPSLGGLTLDGTDATGLLDAALVKNAMPSASTLERHAALVACAAALGEVVNSVPIQRSTPQPVVHLLIRVQEVLAAVGAAAGDRRASMDSAGSVPASARRYSFSAPGHASLHMASDHDPVMRSSARHAVSDELPPPLHPADDADLYDTYEQAQASTHEGAAAPQDDEDEDSMDGFEMWASDAAAAKLALGDAPVIVYERGEKAGGPHGGRNAPAPKAAMPRLGLQAAAAARPNYQDEFMQQAEAWSQSWRDEAGLQPTAAFKLGLQPVKEGSGDV